MTSPVTYLLLAASMTALCQGSRGYLCYRFYSFGRHCTFFSCKTTNIDVTCLYRNISTVHMPAPKWYLDDERIGLDSLQLTEYNDTVWQMVYDYSALSPGEYVFHGEIDGGGLARICCGPQPEVFLNLTVAADKLDSVALKLGQSMKELVLAIVGIVDEATGDDQKQ